MIPFFYKIEFHEIETDTPKQSSFISFALLYQFKRTSSLEKIPKNAAGDSYEKDSFVKTVFTYYRSV